MGGSWRRRRGSIELRMYVKGCEVRYHRREIEKFGAAIAAPSMAPKKTIVKKTLPKAKASGSSGGLVKIEACKS